jgi:hypothetical protein
VHRDTGIIIDREDRSVDSYKDMWTITKTE